MCLKLFNDFSPLRYPGSKQRIAKYIEIILSYNAFNPDVIVEPFVGGGSMFLYFLFHKIVKKAIISDKDKLIYSFWKIVFEDCNYLVEFIKNVTIDIDNFIHYKKVAINEKKYSTYELAEACIFLNRTSFSGIMANSTGPIGGKYQNSSYSIGCRFNKESIINKIKFISTLSKKVKILDSGWRSAIKVSNDLISNKSFYKSAFYYLDPPFYNKAKELYRVYFSHSEHVKLCNFLRDFKKIWILSYDNCKEIKTLYKNKYKQIHIDVPYSINSKSRRIEKEIIITPLNIPRIYK